jgi:hypothetical protein
VEDETDGLLHLAVMLTWRFSLELSRLDSIQVCYAVGKVYPVCVFRGVKSVVRGSLVLLATIRSVGKTTRGGLEAGKRGGAMTLFVRFVELGWPICELVCTERVHGRRGVAVQWCVGACFNFCA